MPGNSSFAASFEGKDNLLAYHSGLFSFRRSCINRRIQKIIHNLKLFKEYHFSDMWFLLCCYIFPTASTTSINDIRLNSDMKAQMRNFPISIHVSCYETLVMFQQSLCF